MSNSRLPILLYGLEPITSPYSALVGLFRAPCCGCVLSQKNNYDFDCVIVTWLLWSTEDWLITTRSGDVVLIESLRKKKKVWSLSSVCTEMWASAVTRDIKQFTWWIWAIRAFARGRGDGAAWLVAGLFDSSSPASDIRGEIVWRCSKDLQGQTLRC